MSPRSRFSEAGISLGGSWSPAVRALIISNLVIYVLSAIIHPVGGFISTWFELSPSAVNHGQIWRLASYMFLHGGIFHVVFNMLMLWMFGSAIEFAWGTGAFLRYYFTCGIGAGIVHWLINIHSMVSLIGASGAIFGVLLAYGMMFPDTIIYLYFFFPVRAKYMVMILGGIEFLSLFTSLSDGISHLAHVAGLFVGFIYLRGADRASWSWQRLTGRFRQRRRARIVDIRERRRGRNTEEIDAILDKISAEGLESLTPVERRRLREAGNDPTRDRKD